MKRAEELADGNLKFEHYPAEQLGKARDILDNTRNKVNDVGYIGAGYVADRMPLSGVGELPGAYNTAVEATEAYWKVMEQIIIEKEYLPNNVRPMFSVLLPPYQIVTKDKQINKLEDFRGVQVRAGGGAQSLSVEALGGIPVSMSAAEVYTGIERGVIDGTVFNVTSLYPYQLQDLVKYLALNSHLGSFPVTYAINEDVWQSLPKEIQDAMIQAGQDTMVHLANFLDELQESDIQSLTEDGVVFYEIEESEIQRINIELEEVWNTWVDELGNRGLPAQEVVDLYRGN